MNNPHVRAFVVLAILAFTLAGSTFVAANPGGLRGAGASVLGSVTPVGKYVAVVSDMRDEPEEENSSPLLASVSSTVGGWLDAFFGLFRSSDEVEVTPAPIAPITPIVRTPPVAPQLPSVPVRSSVAPLLPVSSPSTITRTIIEPRTTVITATDPSVLQRIFGPSTRGVVGR